MQSNRGQPLTRTSMIRHCLRILVTRSRFDMNILEKVQRRLPQLSKSERKVAEAILQSPEQVIHASIATLAKHADVSEPTVNRFCRRLETQGYPDFKLQLAQSLVTGTPYVNRHVNEKDSASDYTDKIFDSTIACLALIKQSLDPYAIEKTVTQLIHAKKIAFFGLGASASVAHDAQNKFFRFNVPILCFDDTIMQRMSAINCQKGDVVILISHTGRTKSLVEIAHIAKENGATVIGITASRSPLDQACHFSICADVPEDTDVYMPMASRVVQMTIIDVLATGFTLRSDQAVRHQLKRVKDSLKDSRFTKSTTH